MKMATTINEILVKAKCQPGITFNTKHDWELFDKALAELAKMDCGKGVYGVIKNSYVDYLANVSFFCGAAVSAVTIAAVTKVVKTVKHKTESKKDEESE